MWRARGRGGLRTRPAPAAVVHNVVNQAITVAHTTVEAVEHRTPEGVGLVSAGWYGCGQLSCLAGSQCVLLEVIQFLIVNIVIEPLVSSDAHQVSTRRRGVVVCGVDAISVYRK